MAADTRPSTADITQVIDAMREVADRSGNLFPATVGQLEDWIDTLTSHPITIGDEVRRYDHPRTGNVEAERGEGDETKVWVHWTRGSGSPQDTLELLRDLRRV